jgi:hypothetical protein
MICQITGSTLISCSTLTVLTATTIDPVCGPHGSITVTISGTNPTYYYVLKDNNGVVYSSFSSSSTSHIFTNLPAGSWNVSVTDSVGNIVVIVTPLILTNLFHSNIQVVGNNICVTLTGGTLPYSLVIDNISVPWIGGDGTNCYSASCVSYTGVTTGGTEGSGSTVHQYDKIVVVIFENHSYNDIMLGAAPNFTTLAHMGVNFTNSHAIGHPSQPNYIHLFAGSNLGVNSDACPQGPFSNDNVFKTLKDIGKTYSAYSENLVTPGSTACSVGGVGGYWRKHAPWTNFNNFGTHATHELDFNSFPTPANYNLLPNLSFVVPNQVNDMHNGSISAGNTWLQQKIFAYANWAITHNSLLIVTFDEDDNGPSNQIPTIFVGANIPSGQTYNTFINHHNVLRTICESLDPVHGNIFPGNSENVDPVTGIWNLTSNPNPQAGVHSVIVHDASGCSATTIVNIICTPPTIILDYYSGSTCGNSGYIQVHATGGTLGYTFYAYDGVNTITNSTGIFTNLSPGIYQLFVVDAAGNTSQVINVTITSQFFTSLSTSGSSTFCFIVTGGTEPIFGILDGQPYGTFLNSSIPQCLSASCGPHTFSLADSNDCVVVYNFTLSCQTLSLIIDTIGNPTCVNSTDGFITLHATGGSIPYTYHLTDNFGNVYPNSPATPSSYTFINLSAGTYTASVTDNLGTTTSIGNIVLSSLFNAVLSISSPLSAGTPGEICVTISGGSGIYDIQITNDTTGTSNTYPTSNTTFCFSATCGYQYSIQITDTITNCVLNRVATSPCDPFNVIVTYTNPTCYSLSPILNGGTITVEATGGTTPYYYEVNNGIVFYSASTSVGYTFSGLSAGSWTVIVNDSGGITYTYPVTIVLTSNTLNAFFSVTGQCQNQGTYCLSVSGGTLPYTVGLTTIGSPYTALTSTHTLISAGTYCFTANCGSFRAYVEDSSNFPCLVESNFSIPCPIQVSISKSISGITCLNQSTQLLTLNYTGGTAPYSFLWSNGLTIQQLNVNDYFSGTGIYSLTGTVIDFYGCSGTSVVTFSAQSSQTPTLLISVSGTLYCDLTHIPTIIATISGSSYDHIYWNQGSVDVLSITAGTTGDYYYFVTIGSCTYTSDTITISNPYTDPPIIDALYYDLCVCSPNTLRIVNQDSPSLYLDPTWYGSTVINQATDGNDWITFTACSAGTYSAYVIVEDIYGCVLTSNTLTLRYCSLDNNLFKVDASCPTCADGYAEIQVISGIPPFTYSWTGSSSTNNVATDLVPGTYCVEITDAAGCSQVLCFIIEGNGAEICIDIPETDPNSGNIRLNPDGSISFYNPNITNARLSRISIAEDCCLSQSTHTRPLTWCNGKCYWTQKECNPTDVEKIILDIDQGSGVQLQVDGDCTFQVAFDYLFNFDCAKLVNCILTEFDTPLTSTVLHFLNGLSLNATVEVLSGSSYITKQEVPIWKFNFWDQPTGVYFNGDGNYCDILNNVIKSELGNNCTAFTENTFAVTWRHASFKVDPQLNGEVIKLGLILKGFNCEYNILIDKLKIEKVCKVTTEDILTDTTCPGFELEKIVDNKKSWVYNENLVNRQFNHLNYRHTSYFDKHEKLDINTKEVDLDIDPARAIEYDTYCYAQSNDCYLSSLCGNPELIIHPVFQPRIHRHWFDCFDSLTGFFEDRKISFPTSGISAGTSYDLTFTMFVSFPLSFPSLSIGFETPNVTPEVFVIDNFVLTGTNTYHVTLTSPGNFSSIYFRISPFVQFVTGTRNFCLDIDHVSLQESCDKPPVDLSNFISINSGTTFEEYKELIQTQLIDVKDRQSISDYPLLRFMFDKYLGFCNINNCKFDSNQYNYDTLNNFTKLLGDYWINLVEQFVPATTIWNGASRNYRNTIFDQPKFEYRNFNLGYCDKDYCFSAETPSVSFSSTCFVAKTYFDFDDLFKTTAVSNFSRSLVLGALAECYFDQEIMDPTLNCNCDTNPSACFISASYNLSFIQNGVTASTTPVVVTSLNSFPSNSNPYVQLLYNGLTTLGFSSGATYNGWNWSKPNNTRCVDVTMVATADVVYSCLTTTITSTTVNFEKLYDFDDKDHNPIGTTLISGATIYGVTFQGTNSRGYIFKYNITTDTHSIIYDFSTGNLAEPTGNGIVLHPNGFLYGITASAYIANTVGGLYKINPLSPTSYQELHLFTTNEGSPDSILLHSNGKFYITCNPFVVGSPKLYEYDPVTTNLTLKKIFNFSEGIGPGALIEGSDTKIYGVSTYGGIAQGGTYSNGGGTIFSFDPTTNTFTKIYDFLSSGGNGIIPTSSLREDPNISGVFYGTTAFNSTNNFGGTLYRLDTNPTTSGVTKLHTFSQTSVGETKPESRLVINNNILFGLTAQDGNGHLFSFNLTNNSYSNQYAFSILNGHPQQTFISQHCNSMTYNSADGFIYGFAKLGGTSGNGTIFRFSSSSGFSTAPRTFHCPYYSSSSLLPTAVINFSASTGGNQFLSGDTPMNGVSCLGHCASFLSNPNIEILIQNITNQISNVCVDSPIALSCTTIYATHIDNDIWFEGSVTVHNPATDTGNGSDGEIIIIHN